MSATTASMADIPEGGSIHTVVPATDGPAVRVADRWLIAGAVVCGTALLSPIGLVIIAIGFVKIARARKTGEFVRPSAVTLFGIFALVDAACNFLGWSLDLWAHDTLLVQWSLTSWGRFVDGAYYLDYNHLWAGGSAAAGEKSWQVFSCVGFFPARAVAAYGFIKLKRWGYRWMVITSWAYVMLWLGYVVNMIVNFPDRFGASLFGVTGWWVFDVWYMTPFLMIPWLYALDRRRWSR